MVDIILWLGQHLYVTGIVGKYEVDYTLPVRGGTKTHTLMVSIKPTFSGGVVKVTLGSNI